jgi:hypothetical protein
MISFCSLGLIFSESQWRQCALSPLWVYPPREDPDPDDPDDPEDPEPAAVAPPLPAMASWLVMVVNTAFTWVPMVARTEMATTEIKARINAYSTKVWPLLFVRVRNMALSRKRMVSVMF